METERQIKERIMERLKNAPKFYLYCSVCAEFLCCSSVFQKYIVHFKCQNLEIVYYNSEDNPPPESPDSPP